jgi:hypothetical protein
MAICVELLLLLLVPSAGCACNAVRASEGVCALAGVQSVCVCAIDCEKKPNLL